MEVWRIKALPSANNANYHDCVDSYYATSILPEAMFIKDITQSQDVNHLYFQVDFILQIYIQGGP